MLRAGQRLGKYKIERRLGDGGFATVYRARDTIEGIRVALKIPHPHLVSNDVLDDFRKEVRMVAKMDHVNTLLVKDASFIEGQFVVVFPLGEKTLDQRLSTRMSLTKALDLADQMIDAVAHAHEHRIIHCDIKPENFILFPNNQIRLTDFGIAKIAQRTIKASGSGTLGYCAPEQAMGKPSLRSDVFSLGLILYRMFSGHLPEWPYDWPPTGYEKLRKRVHPDFIALIRKAIELHPEDRYRDAEQMLMSFRKIKRRALRNSTTPKQQQPNGRKTTRDWEQVRRSQFKREYGSLLEARYTCKRCEGPIAESMRWCPWCGTSRKTHRDETKFPSKCSRCKRGIKKDWRFCAWCFGPGFKTVSDREYTDKRYQSKCANPNCERKTLMPFMRYCPWCKRKVKKKWFVNGCRDRCNSCGWGIVRAFWSHCPWCGKVQNGK